MITLLEYLHKPDKEFTPIPFWFLNDDLKDEEIIRQLEDFADHGVYGIVLHPRIGLPNRISYLSDLFFHYITVAVETAARLGMQVVLYDEGMYPSGSACGQVVAGHPELESQGIALVDEVKDSDIVLVRVDAKTLVIRKSGGTMRGIHFGEDDGEANAPKTADILNPAAVNRFVSLTHEAYYRHLKKYFGNTIIGFFTDEPSILGRNAANMFPWTDGFADIFTEAGGDLSALPALFEGNENESTKLYHRLILERESRVYYKTLSTWCEQHNIMLMGHPHQSDDIEVQQYFHIPGQDLVLRWIAPEKDYTTGIDATMAKCSADAARLMNRRRNSNECFGACNKNNNPWYLTGGDIKWYIDWLAVRGVNLFIPHAFYYSVAGKRSGERPPDVGPNSNWWDSYKKWSFYMARLAFLMTDAKLLAPVAVLCSNRNLKPEISQSLMENQIGFQYIPESLWKDCREDKTAHKLLYKDFQFDAVLGGSKEQFHDVPHSTEQITHDVICSPVEKNLRTAQFTKDGRQCWLFVNEGNNEINSFVQFPTPKNLICYDIWNDCSYRASKSKTGYALHLPVRGSLLFIACTEDEFLHTEEKRPIKNVVCDDWKLIRDNKEQLQKVYTGNVQLNIHSPGNSLCHLVVEAEEIAELRVNGRNAGCSFWGPHTFDISQLIVEGKNDLELTVTGSLANRYGRPVPYGIQ